jgi:hypothetical protein
MKYGTKQHGHRVGDKKTPEYAAWSHARQRCMNPNDSGWEWYGGRGIKFLFTSFAHFLAEIGPRPTPQHSLDRKDNDGNYEPGNVRWATLEEQANNQRKGYIHGARGASGRFVAASCNTQLLSQETL